MSTAAERSAFGGYRRLASPLEGSFYTEMLGCRALKHACWHPVPVDIDMNVIHITYKYNIYVYIHVYVSSKHRYRYIHSSKFIPCPSRVHIWPARKGTWERRGCKTPGRISGVWRGELFELRIQINQNSQLESSKNRTGGILNVDRNRKIETWRPYFFFPPEVCRVANFFLPNCGEAVDGSEIPNRHRLDVNIPTRSWDISSPTSTGEFWRISGCHQKSGVHQLRGGW